MFRDDSLLAFCQKPLNHAYTCLLHPHEEKPLQEQPKRYLGFYHTTGHGQVLPLHGGITQTKNKTEQTEYPWHFPCHWAVHLPNFNGHRWRCPTSRQWNQRGREAANEARRWAVKWPQWPVHSASSPQDTKIPLIHWGKSLKNHREFSDKNRGNKKHKQLVNNHVLQNWMIPLYTWFSYSCEIELV